MKKSDYGLYEWAIVGGGIHGTYLAYKLREAGVQSYVIIDPNSKLMSNWNRNTRNCGQTHLRSPDQHNLGENGESLLGYAISGRRLHEIQNLSGFERPTLGLFNDHCRDTIYRNKLEEAVLDATVKSIKPYQEGGHKRRPFVKIEVEDPYEGGCLFASNVILAMGQIGGTRWPSWAKSHTDSGFHHVFEKDFRIEDFYRLDKKIYVVGGGITAAQLAIKLAELRQSKFGRYPVIMISRNPLRVQELDARALWTRLDYIEHALWTRDINFREGLVRKERNEGTIPEHIHAALMERSRSHALELRVDEVTRFRIRDDGQKIMNFKIGEKEEEDFVVVLATGFNGPNGNKLLKQLSRDFNLPLSGLGYPILDDDLEWIGDASYGRFYVSGELSSLTLGPLAGNIRGAQMSAQLIVDR